MKEGLSAGLEHVFAYTVPRERTVPFLYPESELFAAMPEVFATGYLVGLIEWTCMEALKPHLEEGEGSVGIRIEVDHTAPTPPGMAVTVKARVTAVEGRKVFFAVEARDEKDVISRGTHERFVVSWDRFLPAVEAKKDLLP